MHWYGVRSICRTAADHGGWSYEERIVVFRDSDFDGAISQARAEADEYADALEGFEYLDMFQVYRLDGEIGSGTEVFSLIRGSSLDSDAYVNRFFDTGTERQETE